MVQVSWVGSRFFQDGCDGSQFESGWYSTSSEGGVNYIGDQGGVGRQTCLKKGSGKRIELAGGGFGFKDEYRDSAL